MLPQEPAGEHRFPRFDYWAPSGTGVELATGFAVLWFLGFYASLVTLPHLLDRKCLTLRYSLLDELIVPRAAIIDARASTKDDSTRKRLRVESDGSAMFSCGTATVALTLDPGIEMVRRGETIIGHISNLYITVDHPGRFIHALTLAAR